MLENVDGRNYVRNTIMALSRINKPFIIRGEYFAHYSDNINYVTYINIRPYVPLGANTGMICDHLNIMEEDVEKYIAIRPENNRRKDYLVCRARIYKGKDGISRGGVRLTEELGIPPVLQASYESARSMLEAIPSHKYVNFFSFAEGRYAYYGENLWQSGHKKVASGEKDKKKKKKKSDAKGQPPMSAEEFMKLYDRLNPIWTPPVMSGHGQFDHKRFIHQAIPQRELREILFGWPSLKTSVMNEFIKRM